MLQNIYIKNYAIIAELSLDLSDGLNILTGETGAGKSIIVDAIELAIGGRSSPAMIRYGEAKAIIECTFNISNFSKHIISMIQSDEDVATEELIIRRELTQKGGSRCFVNDSPVSVAKLKQLGALLVDFHGQHEHQSLLDPSNHIDVVDAFADSAPLLADYKSVYYQLKAKIAELAAMLQSKDDLLAKYDILKYQADEIRKVRPKINEDKEIEAELKKLDNAEFLASLSGEIYSLMSNNDNSTYYALVQTIKTIEKLSEFEPHFNDFTKEIESMIISVKEIAAYAKDFADSIEFSPSRIETLRSRYSELKKLTKKYRSVENALDVLERNTAEIDKIETFDDTGELLRYDIKQKSHELGEIAERLSQLRNEESIGLAKEIVDKLNELGFDAALFDVKIETKPVDSEQIFSTAAAFCNGSYFAASACGIDQVEFMIAANKGAMPKPLSETASGGEISRVMLAIKSILAGKEQVPVMVFDEIDTGISGRIAQKVGLNMRELAKSRQIIAITHLPQIAALGDKNIAVSKFESNGKTSAAAAILSPEQKVQEIAKLISGEIVTPASIESAVQLINSEVPYGSV